MAIYLESRAEHLFFFNLFSDIIQVFLLLLHSLLQFVYLFTSVTPVSLWGSDIVELIMAKPLYNSARKSVRQM